MIQFRHSSKHDLLKKVPLFSGLKRSDLNDIAKVTDESNLQAGKVLAQEGKTGMEFVFILEGEARVESDGREIRRLGPGNFFGEIAILDGKPRTATVIAETDIKVLVIHSQYFTSVLKKNPGLQMEIIRALCRYIREYKS